MAAFEKIISEVTETYEELKKLPWVLGVDEAGRGPAIGPMVYSALYWPKKYENLIVKNCSFDDSKKLTAKKRDYQYEILKELKGKILDFETTHLTAEMISVNSYKMDQVNLNTMSHNAALSLINSAIQQGYNIQECYLDTVGPKTSYKSFLDNELKQKQLDVKIVVEEKADSKYKVVSASSICAKVQRDLEIEEIQKKYKLNLGSGYPADPNTKHFLENSFIPVFAYEKDIRFSWQTIVTLMEKDDKNIKYDPIVDEDQQKKKQMQDQEYLKIETNNHYF